MGAVGSLVIRQDRQFDSLKVFSATMHNARAVLGETVTAWLAAHRDIELTEIQVMQSSDAAFHCVTIIVFYRDVT